MTLIGKVALVTGGSRGIGRAIVLSLAQAGADVAINYAGNTAAATETAEAVKAMGRKAILVQGDVADTDTCQAMVKTVVAELGRLDILVNNAGITRDGLLMRMKEEDWDAVLSTNLKSMYNCSKAVLRTMMKQKSGRIINMASVVGETGNAGQANYAAAKAGVIGFTKAIAKEVASRGITANAIAPGFIATDMTKVLGEETQNEMLKTIPLGRPGNPQDVANAVLFFASEEAAYITGQVLNVDGGMVM
jgi:3-oxoacyl-[acyl-carrier protein] reductase